MRHFLPRWWPGTCLLVLLLTTGCQHHRTCRTPYNTYSAVAMGAPVALPPRPAPAVEAPAQASEPVLPVENTLPPVIHTAAKPALSSAADSILSQAPPTSSSVVLPPIAQTDSPASEPNGAVPTHPHFAHDPHYQWLVGTLDYSRIQRAWLLRYVPIEEEDRYGGCVTLELSTRSMRFKPGQIVRVEGSLIDPDSQQLRPAFEVENIRAE